MTGWLSANIGTIVVRVILIAAVALIVRKLLKDKKAGKSICGCSADGTCSGHCAGCSGCDFPKDIRIKSPGKP